MSNISSLADLMEKQLNIKDVDDERFDTMTVIEKQLNIKDVFDNEEEIMEHVTDIETTKEEAERSIKHYSNKHKILLVGEGDFSFAACLARVFGNASNMVATSLDSEDEVGDKYAMGKSNLDFLKQRGCSIMHQVDALTMTEHPQLCNQLFDRIVFNFPHAVGYLWIYREHESSQIRLHRDLVRGFFKSASKMLAEKGEVHVTHKTAHPFDRWYIKDLAEEEGLCFVGKDWFSLWDYPGYRNKKGEAHGILCDRSFPVGECFTFKFRKHSNYPP